MTTTLQDLEAAAARVPDKDRDFANSLVASWKRYGALTAKQMFWADKMIARAANPTADATVNVGDLGPTIRLFDTARQHMKFPKVLLNVGGVTVRLNVAGENAKVPGAINVVRYDTREWLGRITRDGKYDPRGELPGLTEVLKEFATDPVAVARKYAKATEGRDANGNVLAGHCCFCGLQLTDERSMAVGYGRTCAEHFGLPWGTAKLAKLDGVAA